MAVTSARFLARNVSQLLEFHSELIKGAENELRWLIMDLDLLTAVAAAMNSSNDETPLDKSVKKLIYELEDAIDSFLTDAVASGSLNLLPQHQNGVHIIAEKSKELRLGNLMDLADAYMSRPRIMDQRQTIVQTVNHTIIKSNFNYGVLFLRISPISLGMPVFLLLE